MHTLQFVILGYLSGSILFARLFARLHGAEDKMIAESPDHNPGAFNAFAYGGILCGTATVLADLLKGILPVWLYLKTGGDPTGMGLVLVLAAPVVGHIFPAFFRFRGGKGIAVTFGCLLGLLPVWEPVLVFAGVFLFFSVVVKITPNFYRTLFSYLVSAVCMVVMRFARPVTAGFLLITAVTSFRLHRSTEPREALGIKLL